MQELKFTLQDIEAASEAGRMYLPDEEKDAFLQGINKLGEYVAVIRAVDTQIGRASWRERV